MTNPQLISHVRDNPQATATEVHLAERLDEARIELDECIKNFADFLINTHGKEAAVKMVEAVARS